MPVSIAEIRGLKFHPQELVHDFWYALIIFPEEEGLCSIFMDTFHEYQQINSHLSSLLQNTIEESVFFLLTEKSFAF